MYGEVPPVAAPIVTLPLLLPQVELAVVEASAVGPGVLVTVAVVLNVHPLASFTITVYVPAAKPL